MKLNIRLAFFSILGGVLLLTISNLFGVECGLAEPGGTSEGWRGLPTPYYYCGAWGELLSWPIIIIDLTLLSLLSALVIQLGTKLIKKLK